MRLNLIYKMHVAFSAGASTLEGKMFQSDLMGFELEAGADVT